LNVVELFLGGHDDSKIDEAWNGAFLPSGISPNIFARLNIEIGKALADSAIRDKLLQGGYEPVGGGAAQFARLVQDDSAKYALLAKELRIKVD